MVDLTKELAENQTILLVVPSSKYGDILIDTARQLSKKPTSYVTLNKSFQSLRDLFEKNRVNVKNILFIDAITKTIKDVEDRTDQCYFVSSPGALTDLSLIISNFLHHNFDYLIFDSLSSLMIYQEKAVVQKFVLNLVNKIKESKTRAVFYALSTKEHEDFIKQCSLFVDKVIDLS